MARSVLAVPPLALTPDLEINRAANAAQIRHLEAGGVTTLLYGGNANVHNWQVSKFDEWLDVLEESAGADSWLIPSVGPDWGKLLDMAAVLKHRKLPVAMALPLIAPQTPEGVVRGLEEFSGRSGVPLIVYIKTDGYVPAKAIARLHEEGVVFGIKYAVPRKDPLVDPYLDELIAAIGREKIVSGFGEPPALPHLLDFGLAGFTAGCVCIAPTLSMRYLKALQAGDRAGAQKLLQPFLRLEALRERSSAIRVLHQAVTYSGVADLGPMLPLLSPPAAGEHEDIRAAARELHAAEMAARSVPA
ncbi:dihydrodipicolinate synthase family protein [Chelativorans sp.]|uniref:dihydrodipicolinate synthase family protein n=1 Tax=Chelativorans sp. TaxID=2203393 RepID=UPI00281124A5|nr:dihydrodipicolinate synthase family protein [Chelativorans sp.]